MGYYRGDYYRGDYYRGDPFIGAAIGAVAKGLAGGAIGRAVGRAGSWIGRQVGGAGKAVGPVLRDAAPAVVGGGVGMMIPRFGPMVERMGPGMFGGKKQYRRMNPLNPKALRRALRRAEGFEKFAQRTINALYRNIDGRRTRTFKKRSRSS